MDRLYRIHRPMVQALAWRFTGGYMEMEDLVQDAFLRAFRNLSTFRAERASFRTWLYRITSNCCLDHVRRLKTRRTHQEELYLVDSERESTTLESPEIHTQSEQMSRLLRETVTRLPGKQRLALILKHFDGMSIREIATVMKCTEGTVKRHLYRAIRRMRKEMNPTATGEKNEV